MNFRTSDRFERLYIWELELWRKLSLQESLKKFITKSHDQQLVKLISMYSVASDCRKLP